MKVYSTTQARGKLSEIVNQVKYKKIIIALGRNNQAEVLITPIPEDFDIPISEINATSSSFDFLTDEPDIYSVDDIKKRYV